MPMVNGFDWKLILSVLADFASSFKTDLTFWEEDKEGTFN